VYQVDNRERLRLLLQRYGPAERGTEREEKEQEERDMAGGTGQKTEQRSEEQARERGRDERYRGGFVV
jgi:hypothetical protein